jgi:hypothetical protein
MPNFLIDSSLNSLTIRIGLVARICRSHSSPKKTRTDKAGVQFPDSESEAFLLLLVWSWWRSTWVGGGWMI